MTYVWVSFSPFQAAVKHLLMPNLFVWDAWLWTDKKLSHQSSVIKSSLFSFDRWERIYRSAEGSFMKVLQAGRRAPARSWPLSPRGASSDKSAVSLSAFMNEQLDFNATKWCDQRTELHALFLRGNLEDVGQHCATIQLLFTNAHEGDMALDHFQAIKNPSVKPIYNNSTYKNKIQETLLSGKLLKMQKFKKKLMRLKRKKKQAMLIHANLLGPKFNARSFKETGNSPITGKQPSWDWEPRARAVRVHRVLKRRGAYRKGTSKICGGWEQRGKKQFPANCGGTLPKKEGSGGRPQGTGQAGHGAERPRKLVGNSFNTEPSFIKTQGSSLFFSEASTLSGAGPSIPPPSKTPTWGSKQIQRLILHHFHFRRCSLHKWETWSLPSQSHSEKIPLPIKARSRVAHKTPKAKANRKLKERFTQ